MAARARFLDDNLFLQSERERERAGADLGRSDVGFLPQELARSRLGLFDPREEDLLEAGAEG